MKWPRIALLALGLAACGGEVAEEAYDADAPPPPPAPGLEGAATTGPSATVAPDTAAEPR
jgi:hypothetical protein